VTVKKISDVKLEGVTAEATVVDGYTKSVTLTDRNGTILRLALEGHSTLAVTTAAPPVTEQRHAVHIKVLGIEAVEHFANSYEATSRADHVRAEGGEAEVEEVTVTIDDDGNVVP